MGRLRFTLRRAGTDDLHVVYGLLTEASRWLESAKDTDQWRKPWPDENGRNERIREAIEAGRTWIVWDGDRAVATLTASPNDHKIWPEARAREPAVYVRRIVVSREYSGLGLGGQLLDWAGLWASRAYGALWVRVDLWVTNIELHNYYRDQGFAYCGHSPLANYPSAVLFQKPTARIVPPETPLFREIPASPTPPG